MSKYAPLYEYLTKQPRHSLEVSFQEVERIIGAELPESAHRHAAWWANEVVGAHVQARSWMDAEYRVAFVDQIAERVRFEPLG